ncbi:MAG: endolytic transglycosylase MltG [Patescibacteria group bacterium]|nr:MAG: endolytic transglycosylase MltG [Patescibacteria group bacterium]
MKSFLLAVLLVIFAGSFVFLRSDRPVSKDAKSVVYIVNPGDGARVIAEGLEKAALIRSERYFLFTVWRRGSQAKFAAGAFELSPSMTTGEIEKMLTGGKPISNERNVTVLEGWTIDDIAEYLENEGVASQKEFYAEVGKSATFAKAGELPDWAASYPALAGLPATASLEGYLFPDTYRIYADGGAKALVRRMLDNFETKLTPELRAEIAASGRSIRDIVIMASVIEREVRGAEDSAMVSDVFWKRVDAGWGLEADSTVNYITGHSKPSVSYAETRIDHPWNTYKYRGLPAGPIGNPGMTAIIAAIRPKSNPYWYFLTDEAGTVYYGKTLDEHNANKAKYLR